jgi:LuxR family transcriptional regulator, maltose regulon positive regulatory protein
VSDIALRASGRRAPLPPSPLQTEVVRTQVLEALTRRFDVPITIVVAGAGFGKTTALAQAIRANDAAPRGIDAWVSCEPGDEEAARLSAAILAALGRSPRRGESVDRILEAVREMAPIDVCIVIDDLHEVSPSSGGQELISDLARRLPSHVHLLLASREPVPLPLARHRAAGQVVELGVDVLAFSDLEVVALAGLLNEDHASCEGLAGWPSLVRLVLSAPPGAARQFLWEEIVAELSPIERSGLLALAVLGSGTAAEISDIAGVAVDTERLLATVPLLYDDAQGRLGAHGLWGEAVDRIFPATDVHDVRRRALRTLSARGETVRMGSAATRWRDDEMFRAACVSLVRDSLGALPIDTAASWLSTSPPIAAGTPERQLLEVALRYAQRRGASELDLELDELEASFVEADDQGAQAVTLALSAVIAHIRGDQLRLFLVVERIRRLTAMTHFPLLRFLVDASNAALASLQGDIGGALRIIETISFDEVPAVVRELVTRLHLTMLVLDGRADEAVAVASSLADSPYAFARSHPAIVSWLAGDPSGYLASPPQLVVLPDVSHRDRFVRASHGLTAAASLADHELASAMRAELLATFTSHDDARDSAIASEALAAFAILTHDEAAACGLVSRHLDRHPMTNALGEAHLRRNLAIAYVCSATARDHWDRASLGLVHARARSAAQSLLEARAGLLDDKSQLESPGRIVTALPLPWSIELAVRASVAGHADGPTLLRTIAKWLPSQTRRELEWLAEHGEAACASSAAGFLAEFPDSDQPILRVDVLGPIRIRIGEVDVSGPELRRGRVRTLLTLLVLRGSVRRERICDLLWPDLDPAAAAQNLRVTLSRLRRLLSSGPAASGSPSRLLARGDTVELAEEPFVRTDLRLVEIALADAGRARDSSDSAGEIACLHQVVDMWRGEALTDLDAVGELIGNVEQVRRSLVDAALRLGELSLVAGRPGEALQYAERARDGSPYSERAHRLAIACHLQRRDSGGLQSAVDATNAMLAELDVDPEPTTQMLLRRASANLWNDSVPSTAIAVT